MKAEFLRELLQNDEEDLKRLLKDLDDIIEFEKAISKKPIVETTSIGLFLFPDTDDVKEVKRLIRTIASAIRNSLPKVG